MWCVGWGGLSVEVKVLKVLSLGQPEEMLSFHISYSFYQCWRRGLVSVFIYLFIFLQFTFKLNSGGKIYKE